MTLGSLVRKTGLSRGDVSTTAWMIRLFVFLAPVATVFSVRILGTLPILLAVLLIATALVERRNLAFPDATIVAALSSIIILAVCSLSWMPFTEYVIFRIIKVAILLFCATVTIGQMKRLSRQEHFFVLRDGAVGASLALLLLAVEVVSQNALSAWLMGQSHIEPSRVNRPLVIHGIIIWAAFGYLFRFHKFPWPVWIATVLVFLAVALSSTSQSAVIAIVGGAVVWLIASFAPRIALLSVSTAAIAIVALAPWLVELALLQKEAFETGFFASASAIPRLLIWQDVARIIAEHPFLGTGLESTRVLSFFGDPPGDLGATVGANHPHNAALQIRVEFGILGLSLTAALFTALTIRLSRLPADQLRVAASTLAAIVAVSVVSHGMWQSWWLGTILLAVVVAKAYCRSSDERDASTVSQTKRDRHSYDASSS